MHLPMHTPPGTRCWVQEFPGWANVADVDWRTWDKPPGATMVSIFMVGEGGGGGTGVIGANSTAAGGGGGGAGGQSSLIVPAFLLPDVLYVTAGCGRQASGIASRVSVQPNATQNHLVLSAFAGSVGGNGAGATAGVAGTAGSAATIAQNPFSGLGIPFFLGGQNGTAGGTTGAANALALPLTGLVCTGGTGGAGLGAAGVAGTAGGAFTVPVAPSRFPPQPGGIGGSAATTPPGPGSHGFRNFRAGLRYGYGGTGGGSTHGTATGAGLVQARGGDGQGYGCGGGGMGGALTGSTAAVQSRGGAGYVCIISW